MIRDNSTLFLDSGTTTLEVARHIGPMNHLFVVTDSLAVMRELGPRPGVTATLVGGLYNHSSVSTGGPLAVANLRQFHGDLLILGVDGVDIAHGLTGNQPLEVESLRTMIERVDSVVLVADSSKIGRVAFTQIAPLTAADTFVTDRGADPCTLAAFREAGIDVLVA